MANEQSDTINNQSNGKTPLKIIGIIASVVLISVSFYFIYIKTVVGIFISAYLGSGKAQYKLATKKTDQSESFKWYKKAAEKQYQPAYYVLGDRYAKGEGVQQNYAEALKWLNESGESRASYEIGKIYYHGDGMPQDYEQAAKYFHQAVERLENNTDKNKSYQNCEDYVYTLLGKMYYAGEGVNQDFDEAVKYFGKNEYPESFFYLGKIYYDEKSKTNKNYSQIIKYFNKASSFDKLGSYHEKKEWLPDWAFNAAEGQFYNGELDYKIADDMLTEIKKGKQDENINQDIYGKYISAAKERFEIFADIDCDVATGIDYSGKIINLNNKSNDGKQENEYVRLMKELELKDNFSSKVGTCKNLSAKAQEKIGSMYYHGIGFEQNYSKAITYLTKAADYGNAEAEYRLGYMYYYGQGTLKGEPQEDTSLAFAQMIESANKLYDEKKYPAAMDFYLKASEKDRSKFPLYKEREEWLKTYITSSLRKLNIKNGSLSPQDVIKHENNNNVIAYCDLSASVSNGQKNKLLKILNEDSPVFVRTSGIKEKKAKSKGLINLNMRVYSFFSELSPYEQEKQQNQNKGLTLMESASQKGSLEAAKTLAKIYRQEKNYEKAFVFCNQAAQRGDTDSKMELAKMYKDGIGVAKNRKLALQWFEEAYKDGSKEAGKTMSYMLLSDKKYKQARVIFEDLCKKGDASAAYEVGNMYLYGKGVSENSYSARSWYKKGEAGNDIRSMVMLYLLDNFEKKNVDLNRVEKMAILEKESGGKINIKKIMAKESEDYIFHKVYTDCRRRGGPETLCLYSAAAAISMIK